ncbi:MAG: ROK family transcriptional regulator [Prevotella sp.]|jgi:glucokinase-like ROK family protein|nr:MULTISPECIES: ROK family transcriptional regulator [unclassified Prevotella]MCH3970013.1 ROK family transcriptional regulator [Prevotella sp.]MCH3985991.1 ROK family transcriptional regulator [Prevotella sp.]MCH3991319.1 ROK family transcriptional regulator [Prevotella sp.]MCH4018492.1 ROK family transcriptional regulator [Prevotella sp.]MCH4100398.1 ROK family transcriptional regulator [Prevotella sp.]
MSENLIKEIIEGSKMSLIEKNVITYFIHNGNSTITDLAQELNLSIPTTTKFVNEMCKTKILNEFGKLETNEGRRPNLYGLNPTSGYFLGVDINEFSVNIGMMNFKGDMEELKMKIPYSIDNTMSSLDELCGLITNFIQESEVDANKIINININFSGRVNPETGYCYSIFNFSESPLTKIISDKINMHVSIDNDSRSMAYGEYLKGCVKGEKDVLFINISWGLGMGMILDGKLYKGKSGFSGELGHVHTFDNEILCKCGKKGCLETEVSGQALCRIVNEHIKAGESSILSKKHSEEKPYTLEEIIDATNHEDLLCIDIVEKMGQKLGESLAGLINIFNPELVVIGGILSLTGDYLLQPIKTSVRKYTLNIVNKDTSIVLSKLKEKAGITGACMLARTHIFDD